MSLYKISIIALFIYASALSASEKRPSPWSQTHNAISRTATWLPTVDDEALKKYCANILTYIDTIKKTEQRRISKAKLLRAYP